MLGNAKHRGDTKVKNEKVNSGNNRGKDLL